MSATSDRKRGRTGARVELARYSVAAGDRVIYGQRVDGVVRVTDVPAAGGRAYLVERGLEEGTERQRGAPELITESAAASVPANSGERPMPMATFRWRGTAS